MKNSRNPQGGVLNRGLLWLSLLLVMLVVAISAGALQGFFRAESFLVGQAIFEVKPGPLTIDVTVSGTIKAKEQIIIKSEVEGRATVLYLIPEGTQVEKEDLLVELDASGMEDERLEDEIRALNTEAAYIMARESLEIVKNQTQSDIELAELTYEFAKQDLQKYIDGEFPKELKELTSTINLRDEEVTRRQDEYKWSEILFEEKYLSQTQLKADELLAKDAEFRLDLAKADLDLLNEFTQKRTLAQLESDVKQARMALERTNLRAAAEIVQASTELQAKSSEYERQKLRLEKTLGQIARAKIYAPTDGLVIYATSVRMDWRRNEEPLDEGSEVRERQELIYLPTTAAFMAEVKVHESSLEKVRAGLPARITVNALPGKTFTGRVTNIAPLADAQSAFMNPDLKVYKTQIDIDSGDGGDGLRSGMSCEAKIIVARYEDASYVPIQAVVKLDGVPTVHVASDGQWEKRTVEMGLDNNRMIRIAGGLMPGDIVWLTPPLAPVKEELDVGQEEWEASEMAIPAPSDSEPRPSAGSDDSRVRPRRGPSERGDSPGPPGPGDARSSGRQGRRELTPEQREEMRKRFENMSPEEREAMRQRSRQNRGESPREDGSQPR